MALAGLVLTSVNAFGYLATDAVLEGKCLFKSR